MVFVEFRPRALEELKEIDPVISKRIVEKIIWLQQNFGDLIPERLHHGLRELYKLRIGDYRAFYSVSGSVTITIEAVRHRRDAYK
ncbi:type II toxin-antitoxin system RelE/ParE family toxin [Candidatus Kaiserbacteria bacterium]|nr:type II toxin-antitoxin system RelE/ParE family toxin [Candidatus Kaiserbacteria bacterium]